MKHYLAAAGSELAGVAPRAGAWIETRSAGILPASPRSPPARGRGLKLGKGMELRLKLGRPPRGGVD